MGKNSNCGIKIAVRHFGLIGTQGENMKKLVFLAVLSLIPGVGYSQGAANVDSDVDQELDQLYVNKNSENVPTVQVAPAPRAKAGIVANGNTSGQPIYILNQATPNAQVQTTQVQKQPTTIVEASPLVESRADQMRKARQEAEMGTETRIVEKLEQSRIEDEKRRADILFGDKFGQLSNSDTHAQQGIAAQQGQPIPVQVIQAAPQENTRDIVREELEAAMKTEIKEEPKSRKYFSALVGVSEVPQASNVRGNYTVGATFGSLFDEVYSVEGTFLYNNATLNPVYYPTGFYAPDMDVNSYSGAIAMKYMFFNGMVKPVLGGLVQYTYRTYSWSRDNNLYGQGYYNNAYYPYGGNTGNYNENNVNSHAVDLGVIAGANFDFSEKFGLGVEYRYLFNLTSRRNNSAYVYQPFYGKSLESMESYVLSLSALIHF